MVSQWFYDDSAVAMFAWEKFLIQIKKILESYFPNPLFIWVLIKKNPIMTCLYTRHVLFGIAAFLH